MCNILCYRKQVIEEVSMMSSTLQDEKKNKEINNERKIDKDQKISNKMIEKVTAETETEEQWEIEGGKTAYVRNSSRFLSAGFLDVSGEVVEFFNLGGLKAGETITINMQFEGKSYLCFARRDSDSGRIMLFWQNDMIELARNVYRIRRMKSMEIRFTRMTDDMYDVDLVSRAPISGRRGRRKKNPVEVIAVPEENEVPSYPDTFVQGSRGETRPVFGSFDAWETIDEDLAYRKCDASFLENGVDVLPKEVRWYFYANDLDGGQRVQLKLLYKGTSYDAFVVRESERDETRFFLMTKFARELRLDVPKNPEKIKGVLEFARTGEKQFRLTIKK